MRAHTIRHSRLLLVLLSLFVRYAYLLYFNKFSLFVHPKLHIFTYLMIACILMILIYMVLMLDTKKIIKNYSMSWTASIVFVMLWLLPALGAQLDPSILPIVDMSTVQENNRWGSSNWTPMNEANSDMGSYTDTAFVIKLVERDSEWNILLTQDNYHGTIMEVMKQSDTYVWDSIKAYGIVFKGREYKENEFGVGLYQMSCCAADAQIVWMKFMTDWVVPRVGQWVSIVWVMQKDDQWELIVVSNRIRPIPPLDDPYVY